MSGSWESLLATRGEGSAAFVLQGVSLTVRYRKMAENFQELVKCSPTSNLYIV